MLDAKIDCENIQTFFLQHCSLYLRFSHNYFDDLTKLFSEPTEFLNISTKSFRVFFHCL